VSTRATTILVFMLVLTLAVALLVLAHKSTITFPLLPKP
jgi:hypothetical protein